MNEFFYDKNNKINIYHLGKPFEHGSCGNIYKISYDTCLKWFNEDSYCNEEAFEMLMDMDLKNFYKVYKMLYDIYHDFVAYIMKYYDSEDIDFLTMPMSYILDNFYDLFESVVKISDKNILIQDLHDGNVITNKNQIIVIDVDMYYILKNPSKNEAICANYKKLCYLFRDLFINAISKYHPDLSDAGLIINNLFHYKNNSSDVYKKLKTYKYPIDYIRSKRNI